MRKLQSCSIEKGVESRGSNGAGQRPNSDNSPLSGALDRYREVISQAVVAQMLEGQSAFSRKGPLSAWVVIWLMIYQRLDAKGTLAVAVRELLVGSVRRLVPQVDRLRGKPLSASTSAYSQARGRLPLNVAEKVSDLIFESL